MKTIHILAILLMTTISVAGCNCPFHCPEGLYIYGNGAQAAFVLDNKGYPHVAYSYTSNGSHGIRYAVWNGKSFSVQTVVNYSGSSGCLCGIGITLDSSNNPYIDFLNPPDLSNIQIAHLSGNKWTITTISGDVSDTNIFGNISQLFIDAQNNIKFVYATEQNFKYFVGQGNNWSTTTVAQSCGLNLSLVMDSAGLPHLTCGNLYIYSNGVTWFTETVYNNGISSTIALDFNNAPYVAYRQTDSVYLTHKINGGWETMQVGNYSYTNGTGYGHLSLSKIWVLISYNNPIVIAGNTVAKWNGTVWDYSQIPNISGSLQWAAIDSNGAIHLLYTDESRDGCCSNKFYFTLKYIFWDGTKWTTSVVN